MYERRRTKSAERDHHFVRTNHAQILADQFIGQVRVDLARIEQPGALLPLLALTIQVREPSFKHSPLGLVATPGEKPRRPDHGGIGAIAPQRDPKPAQPRAPPHLPKSKRKTPQ